MRGPAWDGMGRARPDRSNRSNENDFDGCRPENPICPQWHLMFTANLRGW